MKERYFDLMEKALSAYSDAHILRYFEDVKRDGLTEHGFPRLCANVGILIAHGRRTDLLPIFLEMMEFCCRTIPTVKAANDFSVREIVCALREIEHSGAVDAKTVASWKRHLQSIDVEKTYNVYAKSPTDTVRNWALFTAVSEYFRQSAGLCDSAEFIGLQLQQQMQWLDENGMYRDHAKSEKHQPMMYDLVPRGLYSILLDAGYCGEYREEIDAHLKRSGLMTLAMQSPCGEIPFGGRSNQFLHNEAWLCIVLEYEAKRYKREGNAALAARCKAASVRALDTVGAWLDKSPIRHVKNRFPTETKFGCEDYAYFDKYMITVASFLYAAYTICDDTIVPDTSPDVSPTVVLTSQYFHKLFLKAGGYGLEFDLDADPHYDANGLGRIHRAHAPSTICLSCPAPANPIYTVDEAEPFALSLTSAINDGALWCLGAETSCARTVLSYGTTEIDARASILCRFANGQTVEESYVVSERGVEISLRGEGELGYALPALVFDGETETEIFVSENSLTVAYGNHICRYVTDGRIIDLGRTAANRNGRYRAYLAHAKDALLIKAEILPNDLHHRNED